MKSWAIAKGNATAAGVVVGSSYVPFMGGLITRLIITAAAITAAVAHAAGVRAGSTP